METQQIVQHSGSWWARHAMGRAREDWSVRIAVEAKRMAPLTVGDLIDRSYKETLLKQQSRREAL